MNLIRAACVLRPYLSGFFLEKYAEKKRKTKRRYTSLLHVFRRLRMPICERVWNKKWLFLSPFLFACAPSGVGSKTRAEKETLFENRSAEIVFKYKDYFEKQFLSDFSLSVPIFLKLLWTKKRKRERALAHSNDVRFAFLIFASIKRRKIKVEKCKYIGCKVSQLMCLIFTSYGTSNQNKISSYHSIS